MFEYVYWKSLLIVVSTSLVVWSQVRWFFLMRIVFHAINHDEQHESLKLSIALFFLCSLA